MSVMTYGMNIILGSISESAVTAYGLYYKVQQFILFAAFGLRDAITPIVSFNHGMRSKRRVKEGVKYGMLYTILIMIIGIAAIELLAVPFSSLFGLSGTTQDICISAMRIISLSFILPFPASIFFTLETSIPVCLENSSTLTCRYFSLNSFIRHRTV